MSQNAEAKALARQFIETLSGPDPAGVLALFAADACIHTTGTSIFSGKRRPAELAAVLGPLFSMVPAGIRMQIKNLIGEGDQAACEVQGSATTVDGRAYDNHYVFWLRVAGGKIIHLSEFMDTRLVDEIFKPQ